MSGRTKRWICASVQASNIQRCGLGEAPAERVRDPAELLPDRDLVDDPRLASAARLRHVHAAEAEFDRELLVPLLHFGRQPALVQLRFDFPGNQLFGREFEGAIAPVPCGCVERDIHGPQSRASARGCAEVPREHVRQVRQGDSLCTLAAHGLGPHQEIEPEAVRQGGQAIGDEGRLDIRIAALLAEPRADEAHHVVVRPVPLRADPPIGRPEPPLAPEREPDRELVREQMVRRKSSSTMASSPATGDVSAGSRRLLAGTAVLVGEVSQGLGQEPFLAPEMQVDDALAKARFLGDRRDRGIGEAAVGDAADRGLDQLLAALFRGRRPALRDHRELAFRAHKNPFGIKLLCRNGTRMEATSYPVPGPSPMNEHIFTQNGRRGPVLGENPHSD